MALFRISCVKVTFAPAATGSAALIRSGAARSRFDERIWGSAGPCARVRGVAGEARQAREIRRPSSRRPRSVCRPRRSRGGRRLPDRGGRRGVAVGL